MGSRRTRQGRIQRAQGPALLANLAIDEHGLYGRVTHWGIRGRREYRVALVAWGGGLFRERDGGDEPDAGPRRPRAARGNRKDSRAGDGARSGRASQWLREPSGDAAEPRHRGDGRRVGALLD